MKRPTGIILSAVILLLASLFQLLMAMCMAFAAVMERKGMGAGGLTVAPSAPPTPSWMAALMYVMCAFCVALAAWGIATTIGLLKLRRWARYSILVIGGLLAFFGFVSVLFSLFLLTIPLPSPANMDAAQAHTALAMAKVIYGCMAFFYALICAVGVWWLVYFNRRKVCEVFACSTENGPVEIIVPSRRPILISVIAALNLLGAASCLLLAFLPFPAAFFGWMLHGWEKTALCLIFAALTLAVAIGLWRLRQWGLRLALFMQAFGLLNCIFFMMHPSLFLRYNDEIQHSFGLPPQQLPERFQGTIYALAFGVSALMIFAIAAILIHYRKAFYETDEISPTETGEVL
ncbi:MAG: hypothetical protein ABR907_08865 [Terracidiphilus sp.]|jgi:hypothetical protein